MREIINEEYMRTVAAVRTGGASDAAESQSDKLQAAAVTVADEAMSEAKRQTPAQKTLREAARGWGRRAASVFFWRKRGSDHSGDAEPADEAKPETTEQTAQTPPKA